jgi:hypothetical protein
MYEHTFGFRRDPNLRASDADREAIGERLRSHHADGRLDADEFQERIDRCYKAKTVGELDELVADLPREGERPSGGVRFGYRAFGFPIIPIAFLAVAIAIGAGWHHGAIGLLWLVPLFFLIRVCVWRRFGRWGMARHHWTERQL